MDFDILAPFFYFYDFAGVFFVFLVGRAQNSFSPDTKNVQIVAVLEHVALVKFLLK